MWRKDTIANEFDLSSIFIVHNTDDVERNINMPSQIIVIVQEVHTNMSGQETRREKNEQLNETPHTEMEMDKNGMACDGKKAKCSWHVFVRIMFNNFLVVNKALNA